MPDKNILKITMLKSLDTSEHFETLPITKQGWIVPCDIYEDGQEIIVEENLRMPEGFCPSICQSIYHKIKTLGFGGNLPYFDEKGVAISCCTDGLRPIIFMIERI